MGLWNNTAWKTLDFCPIFVIEFLTYAMHSFYFLVHALFSTSMLLFTFFWISILFFINLLYALSLVALMSFICRGSDLMLMPNVAVAMYALSSNIFLTLFLQCSRAYTAVWMFAIRFKDSPMNVIYILHMLRLCCFVWLWPGLVGLSFWLQLTL